jgi:CDP-diacylglycerol--glycerol-3-phosphate 3-phosphatidyltransferase
MNVPNILTLLRILLTPLIVVLLMLQNSEALWLATGLFILASLTDWYDGYYARRFNAISKFGQFADPFADKILVLGTMTVLWYNGYIFAWVLGIVLGRDLLVTGMRILATRRKLELQTSRLAKIKTFALILAILSLLIELIYLSQITPGAFPTYRPNFIDPAGILFALAAGLTLLSGLHYIYGNRHLFTF